MELANMKRTEKHNTENIKVLVGLRDTSGCSYYVGPVVNKALTGFGCRIRPTTGQRCIAKVVCRGLKEIYIIQALRLAVTPPFKREPQLCGNSCAARKIQDIKHGPNG
ncbi:hypothetical protein ACU8KH_04361 [Lachancea thermotolerans]